VSEGPIKTGGATYKRRPAYKGVIMQDVSQGRERVRVWPRKRGKATKAKTKELNDAFREAQIAAKYWDPRNIIEIDEWRKGTPILIRDIQVAMMYNRMFRFTASDGRMIYGMPARQDISDALDAVCPLPGAILVRTNEGWRYITPPSDGGLVLTSSGSDAAPADWITPAAAGSVGVSATVATQEATAATAYGNLTTVGPSVTIGTGTEVLVGISASLTKLGGGLGNDGFAAVAVSGATTIAAADANSVGCSYPLGTGGFNFQCARMFKLTGLTAGINTFTLKYRCNGGGAWSFKNRDLVIFA
jgi:hypothetical protein